jgi:hypothetical protein
MALLGPWPLVEGMDLAPFFEEVYGKYSKYVGQLLESGWVCASAVLNLPATAPYAGVLEVASTLFLCRCNVPLGRCASSCRLLRYFV